MDEEMPSTNSNDPEANLHPVPETWPGAFRAYKYSKAAVKFNLGTVLTLFLGSLIISWVGRFLRVPGIIISNLIAAALSIASIRAYLAGSRRQTMALEDALRGCTPAVFVKYVLNTIVVVVVLLLSLALLIVPFFFVLPRLLLASYFVVDRGLGPIAAVRASWDATKGHAGMMWGIIGAEIVMVLPVITIIGIPVTVYLIFMYSAVLAVAYLYVTRTSVIEPVATPDAPAPTTEA